MRKSGLKIWEVGRIVLVGALFIASLFAYVTAFPLRNYPLLDFADEVYRTHRFAILGMSLANLFDVHPAPEYLKAVLNLLAEFDTFHEEGGTKVKVWRCH